jgi:hypothetical protein
MKQKKPKKHTEPAEALPLSNFREEDFPDIEKELDRVPSAASAAKISLDTILSVLRPIGSGKMSDNLREKLTQINQETGRTCGEDLLKAAERRAARNTPIGRKFARVLPRFRLLLEKMGQNRNRSVDSGDKELQ